MTQAEVNGAKCSVAISGLLGGHSGEMIKCGRGNANHIAGRVLAEVSKEMPVSLISIGGGVADNAIPSTASLSFVVDGNAADKAESIVNRVFQEVKGELEGKDEGLEISFAKEDGNASLKAFDSKSTDKLAKMITVMPDGVQAMSAMVAGLVETSLNLGIIKTEGDVVTLEQSVRSSVESSKKVLINKLLTIGEVFGAEVSVSGEYPGWKYRQHSELRDHMVKVYQDMYGKMPQLQAIHAGLECGILSEKIENLDCISIGPDMKDIHSTGEKLSVKSTANVWEYLVKVLAEM
jgi:dipeptidase D